LKSKEFIIDSGINQILLKIDGTNIPILLPYWITLDKNKHD